MFRAPATIRRVPDSWLDTFTDDLPAKPHAKYFNVRFSVYLENVGVGAEWVIWINQGKDDIYIAPERYDSPLKASLHENGESYGGLSNDAAKKARLSNKKRKLEKWQVDRTKTAEPVIELFRVHVPHDDLRPSSAPASSDVCWIPANPESRQTTISLFQFNAPMDALVTSMSHSGWGVIAV